MTQGESQNSEQTLYHKHVLESELFLLCVCMMGTFFLIDNFFPNRSDLPADLWYKYPGDRGQWLRKDIITSNSQWTVETCLRYDHICMVFVSIVCF